MGDKSVITSHFSPFISYSLVICVYIILLKQILSSTFTGNIFFFLFGGVESRGRDVVTSCKPGHGK